MFADEFKITVGYKFGWIESKFANEFLDGSFDGSLTEIFESNDFLLSAFSINEKKGVLYAANSSAVAVDYGIVPNLAIFWWLGYSHAVLFVLW